MLDRLLGVFGAKERPAEVDGARVRVATCVLMLEVAHAEDGFSEAEAERIRDILSRRFELSLAEAGELMEAAEETRKNSHDLWRFTNSLNAGCTPEEKREIVREIWRVIYADGDLGGHEDHLVHRLGTLLNLTHPQLIKEKLAVLEERKR